MLAAATWVAVALAGAGAVPASAPASGCVPPQPTSEITRSQVRITTGSLAVSGTAAELSCVDAVGPAARKARVRYVGVAVYRTLGHGHCRFLIGDGELRGPRSCARPLEFRARGTGRWTLSRRQRVAPGTYLIRSDAVDGFGHHQRPSSASLIRVRVH